MTTPLQITPKNSNLREEIIERIHLHSTLLASSHPDMWGEDAINCPSCTSFTDTILETIVIGIFGKNAELVVGSTGD